MSAAIVPVKELATSKSRLLPRLSAAQREAFCLAMLEDVVSALLATPSLDRVAVATPDERVAASAQRLGAEVVLREDPGLNCSIDSAATALRLAPAEPLLVILGDVAGVVPDDVECLFEALRGLRAGGRTPAAVLAASDDGGTCALLRAPCGAIASSFGPQSALRHREAAAAAGVTYRELSLPSLTVDLDRADDVEVFLRSETGGPRTRELLRQLRWSAADGART